MNDSDTQYEPDEPAVSEYAIGVRVRIKDVPLPAYVAVSGVTNDAWSDLIGCEGTVYMDGGRAKNNRDALEDGAGSDSELVSVELDSSPDSFFFGDPCIDLTSAELEIIG